MAACPANGTSARLEIRTRIIDTNGENFIYINRITYIDEYDAAKMLSDVPVQLLTTESLLYKTLKERGRRFVELNGVRYMSLDGLIILNRGDDIIRLKVQSFPKS